MDLKRELLDKMTCALVHGNELQVIKTRDDIVYNVLLSREEKNEIISELHNFYKSLIRPISNVEISVAVNRACTASRKIIIIMDIYLKNRIMNVVNKTIDEIF